MDGIDADLQAIRDRLTPKQPDDATVLRHLQGIAEDADPLSEGALIEFFEEGMEGSVSAQPLLANRVQRFFVWLRTSLPAMDKRTGQYIACFSLFVLSVCLLSALLPEKRSSQTSRQAYEYCKGE